MQPQRLADLAADRETGLRRVIGSWKIMAISLPRISRIARSQRGDRAFEADRAGDPARRLRQEPQAFVVGALQLVDLAASNPEM